MNSPRRFLLLLFLAATLLRSFATRPLRIYYDRPQNTSSDISIIALPNTKCLFKAVEIRASLQRRNKTVSPQGNAYGVIFAMSDSSNYCSATLCAVDDHGGDGIRDDRCMVLTVSRHQGNEVTPLETLTLNSNIDLDRFDNSLSAEIDCVTGKVAILAGNSSMHQIAELCLTPAETQGDIGFTNSGNTVVDLAVGEYVIDPLMLLGERFTDKQIARSIKNQNTPPVGRWQYLDRNTDVDFMRPGGNYTLAILPSDENGRFDIVYLEGAEINPGKWDYGMLKGTLTATPFKGHYNLIWFDSEMAPLSDECSATLESPTILRLDFPLLKSSVRFYRL